MLPNRARAEQGRFVRFFLAALCFLAMWAVPFCAKGVSTYTTIFSFNGTNGYSPFGGLVQASDGNFYGTTGFGVTGYTGTIETGYGAVFRITPAGVLTNVVQFNGANGANPLATLVAGPDGYLYGTTAYGGAQNFGTVFKMTLSGSLQTLYTFTNGVDGALPAAGLVLGSQGGFYGTTAGTGTNGSYGSVYQITTNGAFTPVLTPSAFSTSGGFSLQGTITVPDTNGVFYAMTLYGGNGYTSGNSGYGSIFKASLGVNQALPQVLFTGTNGPAIGSDVHGGLLSDGHGSYLGTTLMGGSTNQGTLFKWTPGVGITNLVVFTNGNGSQYFTSSRHDPVA